MTESQKAVFLSYASEDAAAARRICDALRAAGIEAWFDQSELRGGDAWDASIRAQIKACALFVPVISRHSQARNEGYFRLEWKLAVDRSHLMASDRAFLLPVVIDDTANEEARVPDKFREVQWLRLPAGDAPAAFIDTVRRLLGSAAGTVPGGPDASTAHAHPLHVESSAVTTRPARKRNRGAAAVALAAASVLAAVIGWHFMGSRTPSHTVPTAGVAADGFSPPAHSLAVLPFVNMSSDKEQDYFSDGLSEELLNSLAKVPQLKVAARTSSFSFKGEKVEVGDIARKLNVAAVLEGSVRKDGSQVRITAQLIDAVSGFHIWSQSYDRDLRNVLALQSEIANAVTGALQATLLTRATAATEAGGTQNPQALDAYLRGQELDRLAFTPENTLARIKALEDAIALDPGFAKAYTAYASALTSYSNNFAGEAETGAYGERARVAANKALALAPDLGESHEALAIVMERVTMDFAGARREYARALELAPNDAGTLRRAGFFLVGQGYGEPGSAYLRKSVELDPLNPRAYTFAAIAFESAGRYAEASPLVERVLALDPTNKQARTTRGLIALGRGDPQRAITDCTAETPAWQERLCLALAYDKAHRRADSDLQVAAMKSAFGKAISYQLAGIYAQRGETAPALEYLEAAYAVQDPGLAALNTDHWLDPIRKEPRFIAIQQKVGAPK